MKMRTVYKVFGIIFIFFSLTLIVLYQLRIYNQNKKDKESVNLYFENEKKEKTEIEKEQLEPIEEEKEQDILYNYIGVLEIPSIKFKRGFLDINDTNNVVDKNIQVLKDSTMPDVVNGNLIIAGHSGNGRIAFLKDLLKLNLGDESYIYYQNHKYIYKLIETYSIEKNGVAQIKNYNSKTILTLITCIPNTEKQIILINELIRID